MLEKSLNNITHNSYYLKLLKNVYSGENGIVKNILQFLYFKNIVYAFDNPFVDVFETIFNDEIKHNNLIGKCIIKLGGEPNFCDGSNIVLNINNIEKCKGLKQIFLASLEIKEKSIINYKILITKIIEKQIKVVLQDILLDEQKHKDMLENALNRYLNN